MADKKIYLMEDQNNNAVPNVGNVILHGVKAVTTAGTQVALMATTQETIMVTIKALAANTNNIYVGDDDVASTNGFVLDAGEEVTLVVDNAQDNIYIDADTNGEGVSYIGWTVSV